MLESVLKSLGDVAISMTIYEIFTHTSWFIICALLHLLNIGVEFLHMNIST